LTPPGQTPLYSIPVEDAKIARAVAWVGRGGAP
jgi:hypothetical protein